MYSSKNFNKSVQSCILKVHIQDRKHFKKFKKFSAPPFLKCLFSNNYRLTRSCKNSTERSHVPFTKLSPALTSYITIAQYQSQWNNMGAIPLAGLYPFRFHKIFHALICMCMLVCTVPCDFITCMVLHNRHHKGTPWCSSFSATPNLSPLPSLISGSH